jgi:hypothetical protein
MEDYIEHDNTTYFSGHTMQDLLDAVKAQELGVSKLRPNIKPGVLGEDILQQIKKIGELQ